MESWRSAPRAFLVLLSPATVWLFVFFLVPLSLVWILSFGHQSDLITVTIDWTAEQYLRAFDPEYVQIFIRSLWMAGLTTAICLVFALPVALGISFAPPRMKALLLLLMILPFWTNLLIRTYALIAVFRTRGQVNFGLEWLWTQADGLLDWVGLGEAALLGDRFVPLDMLYNNFGVLIGLVYVHFPFMVLPLYAAVERLDRSYLEASLDLGAGQIRTFFSVVVPLAVPGIISGVILVMIPALGSFLVPELLGGTENSMIANVIERQFGAANNWPFGAALSFILLYATFGALALRSIAAGRRGADF
ncbi:MAG: ABC transporter permease [Alphaproteobacteria bacterium]